MAWSSGAVASSHHCSRTPRTGASLPPRVRRSPQGPGPSPCPDSPWLMRRSERNPLNRLAGMATSQGTTLNTQPCGEGQGRGLRAGQGSSATRPPTPATRQGHPHPPPVKALLAHRPGLLGPDPSPPGPTGPPAPTSLRLTLPHASPATAGRGGGAPRPDNTQLRGPRVEQAKLTSK